MGEKRDRRKTAKHSREKLPIGTLRVHRKGKRKIRKIKVRDDGPVGRRWMLYARYLWERDHGPVPDGMRVVHKDYDTLNDDPANLILATPGDVVYLWHHHNPKVSEEHFRKLRQATAKHNRERGAVNRRYRWLPTRWYPVYLAEGYAINDPKKSRRQVLAKYAPEMSVSINGHIADRRLQKLPFTPMRGREIASIDPPLRKVDPDC